MINKLIEIYNTLNLDCGDNSCYFSQNKSGMRTNAQCRCFQELQGKKRRGVKQIFRLIRHSIDGGLYESSRKVL